MLALFYRVLQAIQIMLSTHKSQYEESYRPDHADAQARPPDCGIVAVVARCSNNVSTHVQVVSTYIACAKLFNAPKSLTEQMRPSRNPTLGKFPLVSDFVNKASFRHDEGVHLWSYSGRVTYPVNRCVRKEL